MLELITSFEEFVVSAQRDFLSGLTALTPDLPAWPATDGATGASVKEVLQENFAFQAKLLDANRDFPLALIEAWTRSAEADGGQAKPAGR